MLVLTRKLMEKLYIGDDICVTVVRLEGGQVRLGIEAPRDVPVVRAELVPERDSAYRAAQQAQATNPPGPQGPPTHAPGPAGPRTDGGVRIPPAAAHGTGSRRRGRSR
jgi:carbon storage regulator